MVKKRRIVAPQRLSGHRQNPRPRKEAKVRQPKVAHLTRMIWHKNPPSKTTDYKKVKEGLLLCTREHARISQDDPLGRICNDWQDSWGYEPHAIMAANAAFFFSDIYFLAVARRVIDGLG